MVAQAASAQGVSAKADTTPYTASAVITTGITVIRARLARRGNSCVIPIQSRRANRANTQAGVWARICNSMGNSSVKRGLKISGLYCGFPCIPPPAVCDGSRERGREMQWVRVKCKRPAAALLFFARHLKARNALRLPWQRLLARVGAGEAPRQEKHEPDERIAHHPGHCRGNTCFHRCCHALPRATVAPGPLAGGAGGLACGAGAGWCRLVPDPPPGGQGPRRFWWSGRWCAGDGGGGHCPPRRRAGVHRRAGHGHPGGHHHAAATGVGCADAGAVHRRADGDQGPAAGTDRPAPVPAGADAGAGYTPARRGPVGQCTYHLAALPDLAGAGLDCPPGRGHPGRAGAAAGGYGHVRPRVGENRTAQP